MFDKNQINHINNLILRNIEILEFDGCFNAEFKENINKIETMINEHYILLEEKIVISKLKMMIEICETRQIEAREIIENILIIILEINEFKTLIQDNYGIGKIGYWSFRKEFRQKELEINKLESEFYLKSANYDLNQVKSFDEIALKFKKSLDRTKREGWL